MYVYCRKVLNIPNACQLRSVYRVNNNVGVVCLSMEKYQKMLKEYAFESKINAGEKFMIIHDMVKGVKG